jgi:hypothetical protein
MERRVADEERRRGTPCVAQRVAHAGAVGSHQLITKLILRNHPSMIYDSFAA